MPVPELPRGESVVEFSSQPIAVVVTLLPGFLAVRIRDFFLPPRQRPPLELAVESIAFSLVTYLIALPVLRAGWTPPWLLGGGGPADGAGVGSVSFRYHFVASIGAIAVGLVTGFVAGRDWHYAAARRLRLTHRTGRDDVWQDVFSQFTGNWLLASMADGRRVRGWALYYSDHGDQPCLFLRDASWITSDNGIIPIVGPGILVLDAAQIRYIEFLKPIDEGRHAKAHA